MINCGILIKLNEIFYIKFEETQTIIRNICSEKLEIILTMPPKKGVLIFNDEFGSINIFLINCYR